MKNVLILFVVIIFSSCNDAFINHKLTYEKIGACTDEKPPVKMLSNIAGERYEFVSCLNDDFDGKNYLVERKGDSIVVNFPNTAAAKSAFKLTLDIDAKPAYRHIILDGSEILVEQQQ